MLPEVLTTNQLSLVISQAAAPAFLLGAVASFLSVLVSHMSRNYVWIWIRRSPRLQSSAHPRWHRP